MRKKYFCLILVFSLITPIFSSNISNVAILDFEATYGIEQGETKILTDRLRDILVNNQRFSVIERAKMEQILNEMSFQLSGCTSDACAIKVGELLNVNGMIAGSIGKIGETYSISVRLINVETGHIENTVSDDYTGKIDGLLKKMESVAYLLSVDSINSSNNRFSTEKEEVIKTSEIISEKKPTTNLTSEDKTKNNKKERTGWGWGGVPAINYNADEGFGYGVVGNIFNYADGGYVPYYWTVQPQIFFTTGGKQEHWLWFDSPYILGRGIRVTAELKMLKQLYNPYYGIGNESSFDELVIIVDEDDVPEDTTVFLDKHYYTHNRERLSLKADFKKALSTHENGRPKLSVLLGFGLQSTTNELNGDTSKLAEDLTNGDVDLKEIDGGLTNYIKLGVVHDTRDNEPAPNTGHWTDFVIEIYPKLLGSDYQYSRLTLTDRRYFAITKKLVYAQRLLFEKNFGDIPFYEMSFYGSSFKVDEGLGGSKSLRGVLKNRYLGPTKMFANLEIRYKFMEFSAAGQDFYLATNEFLDLGKVWGEDDESDFSNIHISYGAGLHIGWNENFIIAVDGGTSDETGLQLYIGLGYLF